MLRLFEQPQNLPLPEFARLAHKSRQQIYKDLAAKPRRLLALSVGPRKQRLPDWQLDPLRLRLTQDYLSFDLATALMESVFHTPVIFNRVIFMKIQPITPVCAWASTNMAYGEFH
jgi:hypothetical protein